MSGLNVPDYLNDRVAEILSATLYSVVAIREAVLAKIQSASLPNEAERRRYALLQAAATIWNKDGFELCPDEDPGANHAIYAQCVTEAIRLLAEIEKGEQEGQS